MGTPGPAPRPANLRLLNGRNEGVDSGGRHVKLPPLFERGAPEPPAVVMVNDDALAEWQRVVPELARLDLIKPIDAAPLAAYCLAWARLVDAQRSIEENGYMVPGGRGEIRNPACSVVDSATRELRQWAGEFGLTPSAESRMVAPPSGAEDPESKVFD